MAYTALRSINTFQNYPWLHFRPPEKTLTVGHIGSLYLADPFRQFVLASLRCQETRPLLENGTNRGIAGNGQDRLRFLANFESFWRALMNGMRLNYLSQLRLCEMYPNNSGFPGANRLTFIESESHSGAAAHWRAYASGQRVGASDSSV